MSGKNSSAKEIKAQIWHIVGNPPMDTTVETTRDGDLIVVNLNRTVKKQDKGNNISFEQFSNEDQNIIKRLEEAGFKLGTKKNAFQYKIIPHPKDKDKAETYIQLKFSDNAETVKFLHDRMIEGATERIGNIISTNITSLNLSNTATRQLLTDVMAAAEKNLGIKHIPASTSWKKISIKDILEKNSERPAGSERPVRSI